MILPTAYLAPPQWYSAYLSNDCCIEAMESFVKQTARNRCIIHDAEGREIRLTVPVKKVEHKQLTQDILIDYTHAWQHQHWMALVSAYGKTPYWDYYADMLQNVYSKQTKYLMDLNDQLTYVIIRLLKNDPTMIPASAMRTTEFANAPLESFLSGASILNTLMDKGPLTIRHIMAHE